VKQLLRSPCGFFDRWAGVIVTALAEPGEPAAARK
jgi:hypothetical protein